MSTKSFKVDFFVAGFPKCGTTSLAYYLAQHPGICFSSVKEPFYFCTDFPQRRVVRSAKDYQKLFSPTAPHQINGEGTACYIYSKTAITQIIKNNPRAKFIILIRKPTDLVVSLHSNQLRALDESEQSLKSAWNIQAERRKGRNIPKRCREPFFLQYREVALQGKYIQQLLDLVPRDQILIHQLDELIKKPASTYNSALSFLGVDPVFTPDFNQHNQRMEFKSGVKGALGKKLASLTRNSTLQRLKHKVGIQNLNIEQFIKKKFMHTGTQRTEDHEFRNMLKHTFDDDLNLLSSLTSIDLSHWR